MENTYYIQSKVDTTKMSVSEIMAALDSEKDVWNFIETFLPDYHHRDDVMFNDIVSRFVNHEEIEDDDYGLMESFFGLDHDQAERWLEDDTKRLFLEAVASAYDKGQILNITAKK